MLTVDGSTRISDAHGVLTVKDGEDKKADKSETPVNPTDGNHSSDDKTSKPADNNQPSADKVTKSDEPSKDNNTKVAVKLATTPKIPSDSEDSNSNILSILTAIFAAIGSLALFGYVLVIGKIHLPKK